MVYYYYIHKQINLLTGDFYFYVMFGSLSIKNNGKGMVGLIALGPTLNSDNNDNYQIPTSMNHIQVSYHQINDKPHTYLIGNI